MLSLTRKKCLSGYATQGNSFETNDVEWRFLHESRKVGYPDETLPSNNYVTRFKNEFKSVPLSKFRLVKKRHFLIKDKVRNELPM